MLRRHIFSKADAFSLLFRGYFRFYILNVTLCFRFCFPFFRKRASRRLRIFRISVIKCSMVRQVNMYARRTKEESRRVSISVLLLRFLRDNIAISTIFSNLFRRNKGSFFSFFRLQYTNMIRRRGHNEDRDRRYPLISLYGAMAIHFYRVTSCLFFLHGFRGLRRVVLALGLNCRNNMKRQKDIRSVGQHVSIRSQFNEIFRCDLRLLRDDYVRVTFRNVYRLLRYFFDLFVFNANLIYR